MAAEASLQVLVTRPAREAARWVDALRAQGIGAAALPLIAIGPALDAAALERSRARLADYAAVMFVSANAVEGLLPQPGAWPGAGPRAWCTGPGTGAALRRAGVPPGRIDQPAEEGGQFDSEALWSLVHGQVAPGDRVLIVRGADRDGVPSGRDWLASRLRALGVAVDLVAGYRRELPDWGPAEQALALNGANAGGHAWWLFSSSEAIGNLLALCPALDRPAARALCTHARIAAAARDAGFGEVIEVAPGLGDVAAFLQSHP